mmetsp:Transcript_3203/g.8826  ORF Transcript_3203/g.8826 Transcript_3203/m.8826 type:complete len:114 (-) Transcript_3203:719-1060(-)
MRTPAHAHAHKVTLHLIMVVQIVVHGRHETVDRYAQTDSRYSELATWPSGLKPSSVFSRAAVYDLSIGRPEKPDSSHSEHVWQPPIRGTEHGRIAPKWALAGRHTWLPKSPSS